MTCICLSSQESKLLHLRCYAASAFSRTVLTLLWRGHAHRMILWNLKDTQESHGVAQQVIRHTLPSSSLQKPASQTWTETLAARLMTSGKACTPACSRMGTGSHSSHRFHLHYGLQPASHGLHTPRHSGIVSLGSTTKVLAEQKPWPGCPTRPWHCQTLKVPQIDHLRAMACTFHRTCVHLCNDAGKQASNIR